MSVTHSIFMDTFIYSFLLALSIKAQDACIDEFHVTDENGDTITPGDIDDHMSSFRIPIKETTGVGVTLYTITWLDDLQTSPYVNTDTDDDGALDYLQYDVDEGSKKMTVSVLKSMEGIIDYDNSKRKEKIYATFYFQFTTLGDVPCSMLVNHEIQDQNTKTPQMENDPCSFDIREDFPIQLTWPYCNITVYDYDADSPNNLFEMTMNSKCVLTPTFDTYQCSEGSTQVQFHLTTPLDYDTMISPYQHVCNVTVTDHGDPPRSSKSQILINVRSFSDENPSFTSPYYKGQLLEAIAGSVVLVDPAISASDMDNPPTNVTYTMDPADPDVEGSSLFSIDHHDGTVTVMQTLDDEFLSYSQVDYILTACDESSQCSRSMLNINLPFLGCNLTSLQFEKLKYTIEDIPPRVGQEMLTIHAQSSTNQDGVVYSLSNDGSTGLEYFAIDGTSGSISATQSGTPAGNYSMVAFAHDGANAVQTSVNIGIIRVIEEILQLEENYVMTSLDENSPQTLLYTANAGVTAFYCFTAVYPEEFVDSFSIDNQSGEIYAVANLDADDELVGHKASLKIGAYEEEAQCVPSVIGNHVLSNEMILEVVIKDVNEFSPVFVDLSGNAIQDILFAFPQNLYLQRAVGHVGTVMTTDNDLTKKGLIYSLESATPDFVIDSETGEIFSVGLFVCFATCHFRVVADDQVHEQVYLEVNVTLLYNDYIFSMELMNTDIKSINEELTHMSMETNANINLLYAYVQGNGQSGKNGHNGQNGQSTKSENWNVKAQVYVVDGDTLMDLQEFSSLLESANIPTLAEYSSDNEYTLEIFCYRNGYKTATIILGCLLGTAIILILGGVCYLRKKKVKSSAGKIATLGKAYANPLFRDDNEMSFATIFGEEIKSTPLPRSTVSSEDDRRSNTSVTKLIPNARVKPETFTVLSTPSDALPKMSYKDENSVRLKHFPKKEEQTNVSSAGHSSKVRGGNESEMEDVSSSFAKLKGSPVIPRASFNAPSAPVFNSDSEEEEEKEEEKEGKKGEEEEDSVTGDRKSSSLKTYPDIDLDDEPKSVAFKVLVDTKEYEEHDVLNADDSKFQLSSL